MGVVIKGVTSSTNQFILLPIQRNCVYWFQYQIHRDFLLHLLRTISTFQPLVVEVLPTLFYLVVYFGLLLFIIVVPFFILELFNPLSLDHYILAINSLQYLIVLSIAQDEARGISSPIRDGCEKNNIIDYNLLNNFAYKLVDGTLECLIISCSTIGAMVNDLNSLSSRLISNTN